MIDLSKIESNKEYVVKYKHRNGNVYTTTLSGIALKILIKNGSIVEVLDIKEAPETSKPEVRPKVKPTFRKPTPKVKLVDSPKKKAPKTSKPVPKPEPKQVVLKRAKENLKDPIPQPKPVITPKPTPKPPIQPKPKPEPKPISTPKPILIPTLKEGPKVTTTSTSPEKPKTGVLELAKKYWWVLGVLGVGLVILKR